MEKTINNNRKYPEGLAVEFYFDQETEDRFLLFEIPFTTRESAVSRA